jgi:type I restriction enzyme S subunit
LKEVGFFTGGGTPSMSNSNYWDGDISWISPKDMGLDYISESEMKITKLGVENSAAK